MNKPENFDERGKFLPGNQIGKIKKKKAYDIEELKKAIQEAEKGKDHTLLVHFFNKAYESNQVLIALIKKLIPDISVTELKGDGSAWNVFITQFLDLDLPEDLRKKIEDYKKKQLIKEQGEGENQTS